MDNGPDWVILLMYWSHDMRHIGFRRLTVVNGTPRIGASQNISIVEMASAYTRFMDDAKKKANKLLLEEQQ